MKLPRECIAMARLRGEAVLLLDEHGRIHFANMAASQLLGRDAVALQDTPLEQLTAGDSSQLTRALRGCLRTSAPVVGRLTLVAPGGGELPFPYRGILLRPRDGESPALIALQHETGAQFRVLTSQVERMNTEIRKRRRREREIRASEAHLKAIWNSIGDGAISTDTDGVVTRMNPVAEQLTGWDRSAALGRPLGEVFRIINARTSEAAATPTDKVLETGAIVGLANHTVLIARDGTRRHIADSAAPIHEGEALTGVVLVFRDVTDEYLANARLERERAFAEAVFQTAGALIIVLDPEGRITRCNDAFKRTTGQTDDALSGRRLWELLSSSEDRDELARLLTDTHHDRFPVALESTLQGASGPRRIAWSASHLTRGDGGGFFIVAGLDLTRRVEMERALRESEQRLRTYIDSAPDAVFITDLKGRFAKVNTAAAALTGFSEQQLLTMSIPDILHPDSRQQAMRSHTSLISDGTLSAERRALRADGSSYWMGIEAVNIDNRYNMAFCRDVTERRDHVAELSRLSAAMEQAFDAIVITNAQGVIAYVNPAFEQSTGIARAEALGTSAYILSDPDVWSTVSGGRAWSGRLQRVRGDGSISVEDGSVSPVRSLSGDISGYVAVTRDVSEELRLADELRQSQRMEMVGRLAGGISHDFNNMLTVILTCCSFMGDALNASDPIREDLNDIISATQRAESLTRQLLAFSRRQELQPKVFNLNDTIAEFSRMLHRLIGADIELRRALDPALSCVKLDQGQVEQILMNLTINARHAMPSGGVLSLETADVAFSDDAPRHHAGLKPGRYVRLIVEDTGVGMSAEVSRMVFEPFFTTKGTGEGTGLGLSTVYGIVKQSGGYIYVKSAPGEGARFTIYFPAADGQAESEAPPALTAPPRGKETILIVEDDAAVRRVAARILEREGYRVLQADSATDAISMVSTSSELDLLLCDVIMPDHSGPEIAALFKEATPELKVMFMSGYTADHLSDHDALLSEGRLLQKPFTPHSLAFAVRTRLDNT